jgi:hypothetical protein
MATNEAMTFRFDSPDAKGVISVRRDSYGIMISVNGQEIAAVDLYHLSDNRDHDAVDPETKKPQAPHAMLCIYGQSKDESLTCVRYMPQGVRVWLPAGAERICTGKARDERTCYAVEDEEQS